MPNQYGDVRPDPDPTRLTLAALDREIARVERLIEIHVEAIRQNAEMQYTMRDLRFELLERQRLEIKTDNQKAIDISLEASNKDLAALTDTYQNGHASLLAVIDDVKSRLVALEAKAIGSKEVTSTTYVVIGLFISFAVLAATAINVFWH